MANPPPNFSEISSLHSREHQLARDGSVAADEGNGAFAQIIEEIDQYSEPDRTKESIVSEPESEAAPEGGAEEEAGDEEPSLAMDDKDARRLLIVNYIRKRMEEIEARKAKPGFEDWKEMLGLFETAKSLLLALMIVFILFSRPEWCRSMRNSIDYSCVQVLDPTRQVRMIKSWIPVLSSSTKYVICTLSMLIICVFDSMKVGFSVSNAEERSSTILGIAITLGYLLFSTLDITGVYSLTAMDLFPVFFLLTSLKLFRKSMLLFLEIIARAKFVFLYAGLFIFASSALFFILFNGFDDLTDAPEGAYYTYAFKSYPQSLLSGVLALLGDKINIPGIMAYFMHHSAALLALFILVSFFSKFFVQSYIIGVTYYFFSRYFKDNVLDLRAKHPELEATITQMVKDDRLSVPELNQALDEYMTPAAEKDSIIEIEKFYVKAAGKIANRGYADNPDSGYRKLSALITHDGAVYVLTGLEVLVIALLIITVETDNQASFSIYIAFYVINFVTILRQVMTLAVEKFRTSSVVTIVEIVACLVVNSLIAVSILSGNPVVFDQVLELNSYLKKIIGVLMAVKTLNFFKLLLRFPQIKMTILMLLRCFRFIMDILVTIFIIIFIFSSIGIAFFGGQVNDHTGDKYQQVYGEGFNPNSLMLNFNDYYYAFLTLLTISFKGVILVLRMNTVEKGENGNGPMVFFIAYLFLINTCLLNILFGFLIDNIAEYLKDHRMDFTEGKYAELAKRQGGDGSHDGDDGGDGKGNESALKKSELGPDHSRFSEDLDVYLNLKKKKEEQSQLEEKLPEIAEEPEPEQAQPEAPVEAEAAVEEELQSQKEAPAPAEPSEQEFRGTPVNLGGRTKFNPLSGIVQK